MPAQTRQTPTTTTTAPTTEAPTTSGPTTAPDLTQGRGNAAVASDVSGPEAEASLLAEEPQLKEARAGKAEKVTLSAGKSYSVTAADMEAYDPWTQIARNNGCSAARLQAFNQHVQEVDLGQGPELQALPPTTLAVGAEIYIPSGQELAFAECRRVSKSYDEAVALYGKMAAGPNVKLIDAATQRASGDIGQGYGTQGVNNEGSFYTPNAEVAGAKKGPVVGGKQQYKVFWLADFWKCSIFMNDVVFQAGYKPALTANKHYATAGNAHKQPQYKQVKAADAMPGDGFQKFGGGGSNDSHNGILSTFIDIKDLGDGTESWTFSILGSESERAAESEHESIMDKATGKIVGGYGAGSHETLRFLRPTQKR